MHFTEAQWIFLLGDADYFIFEYSANLNHEI